MIKYIVHGSQVHLHDTTAAFMLRKLAKSDFVRVAGTTFMVPRYPQVVHPLDLRAAFEALADKFGARKGELVLAENYGVEALCSARLFEKIFRVLFVEQKVFPRFGGEGGQGEDRGGRDLPVLYIGTEKTQVRQVPLADRPPWPFKFLLELGGMVVVKSPGTQARTILLELRQFLSNYPRYDVRVDVKEAPDGSLVIYTWWFEKMTRRRSREG